MISSVFSPEKNEEYKKILCEGNVALRILAKQNKVSLNKFRRGFFKNQYSCLDPVYVAAINAVKNIQEEIVLAYIPLINKIAHSFFNRRFFSDSAIEHDDYLSETYLGFMDAIYTYDGRTKFITYATWTTSNHLCNFITKSGILSRSPKVKALVKRIKEIDSDNMSLDEIVQALNLDTKDRKRLDRILNFRIYNETSLSFGYSKSRHSTMDRQTQVNILESVEDFREVVDEDKRVLAEALTLVKLSTIESDVLDAYLTHGKGWYDVVRSKHTSPSTGRAYSHQAIYLILERVIKRIKAKCKSLAA